jgi:hypothetical protein
MLPNHLWVYICAIETVCLLSVCVLTLSAAVCYSKLSAASKVNFAKGTSTIRPLSVFVSGMAFWLALCIRILCWRWISRSRIRVKRFGMSPYIVGIIWGSSSLAVLPYGFTHGIMVALNVYEVKALSKTLKEVLIIC